MSGGKFCKLEAGKGFLEGERELVPERVELAEMEANVFVLHGLRAFDLKTWVPATTCEQVKVIALRVASAHYVMMKYGKGSGMAQPTAKGSSNAQPTLSSKWLKEAEEAIEAINAEGFIILDDGERQFPKKNESVFVERVR